MAWRLISTQVKEPGHADTYEGLVIDFKPGKKPHLIIEDDAGEELERIDLAPLSTDEIHELVQSKGFVRQEQEPDAGAAEELAAQAEAVADAEATL
jgi:hypothetical protein